MPSCGIDIAAVLFDLFFLVASVKFSPGHVSAKDLQSVTLKDQLGRASALHHSFQVGSFVASVAISLYSLCGCGYVVCRKESTGLR